MSIVVAVGCHVLTAHRYQGLITSIKAAPSYSRTNTTSGLDIESTTMHGPLSSVTNGVDIVVVVVRRSFWKG